MVMVMIIIFTPREKEEGANGRKEEKDEGKEVRMGMKGKGMRL